MDWLRKNISFILSVIALVSVVGGFLLNIIPRPASAADLDKLADSVQQMHDIHQQDSLDNKINRLQDQIAMVKLNFMVAGKAVSPEAQFYIDQKQLEIDNLK